MCIYLTLLDFGSSKRIYATLTPSKNLTILNRQA